MNKKVKLSGALLLKILAIPLLAMLVYTSARIGVEAGNLMYSLDVGLIEKVDMENFKSAINSSLPIIGTIYNSGKVSVSFSRDIKNLLLSIFNFDLDTPYTILNAQSPMFLSYYRHDYMVADNDGAGINTSDPGNKTGGSSTSQGDASGQAPPDKTGNSPGGKTGEGSSISSGNGGDTGSNTGNTGSNSGSNTGNTGNDTGSNTGSNTGNTGSNTGSNSDSKNGSNTSGSTGSKTGGETGSTGEGSGNNTGNSSGGNTGNSTGDSAGSKTGGNPGSGNQNSSGTGKSTGSDSGTVAMQPVSSISFEEEEEEEKEQSNIVTHGQIVIQNYTKFKIDIAELLSEPLKINFERKGPKVLIYHTHTTESYVIKPKDQGKKGVPSFNTDPRYNVVRVGEELARNLKKYGIDVLHNGTVHDANRNAAYGVAIKTLQNYIKSYPSIKVFLDIHRDGLDPSLPKLDLVKKIKGKNCAQVMFVVGTNGMLPHPNWKENLKFALQLQQDLNEKYPGLTRPIWISTKRYNEQVSNEALIIEVGGDGNLLSDCLESTKYVAEALNDVLKGK